jgi:hypothetical protein
VFAKKTPYNNENMNFESVLTIISICSWFAINDNQCQIIFVQIVKLRTLSTGGKMSTEACLSINRNILSMVKSNFIVQIDFCNMAENGDFYNFIEIVHL